MKYKDKKLNKIDAVRREGDLVHILGRGKYLHHIICDFSTGDIIEEHCCREYSEVNLDIYTGLSFIGIGVPLFFWEVFKKEKYDEYLRKVKEYIENGKKNNL